MFFYSEVGFFLDPAKFGRDTLPKPPGLDSLRQSIFIPPSSALDFQNPQSALQSQNPQSEFTSSSQFYGTRTQTVILVDYDGCVTFVERNLWYEDGSPVPLENRDQEFTFLIQDW